MIKKWITTSKMIIIKKLISLGNQKTDMDRKIKMLLIYTKRRKVNAISKILTKSLLRNKKTPKWRI